MLESEKSAEVAEPQSEKREHRELSDGELSRLAELAFERSDLETRLREVKESQKEEPNIAEANGESSEEIVEDIERISYSELSQLISSGRVGELFDKNELRHPGTVTDTIQERLRAINEGITQITSEDEDAVEQYKTYLTGRYDEHRAVVEGMREYNNLRNFVDELEVREATMMFARGQLGEVEKRELRKQLKPTPPTPKPPSTLLVLKNSISFTSNPKQNAKTPTLKP